MSSSDETRSRKYFSTIPRDANRLEMLRTENVRFGRTGLHVPPIIFGATSLGNLFHAPSDQEKEAIVKAWANSGFSPIVIDSAGKYGAGMSLEVIGRELARLGFPKDRVVISNKLGWRQTPLTGLEPTFEPGVWINLQHDAKQDISRDGILRCWEEGNRLLGGYRASLLSVHDPDEYLDAATDPRDRSRRLRCIIEAYETLCELRDSGQATAIGIGAKQWRAIHELDQHCDFDWVMFANSFTILHHPPELLDFIQSLAQRDIGIINSALFHGGFLLGGNFFDYRSIDMQRPEDRLRVDFRRKFHEICRAFGVTPFEAGVAFGRAHPAIAAVALSSSRADRVASHVTAATAKIPGEMWQQLEKDGLITARLDQL